MSKCYDDHGVLTVNTKYMYTVCIGYSYYAGSVLRMYKVYPDLSRYSRLFVSIVIFMPIQGRMNIHAIAILCVQT